MDIHTKKYLKTIPEFKRQADLILSAHIPENAGPARDLINRALEERHPDLLRWFRHLAEGLITAEKFVKLIRGVRDILSARDLKSNGTPDGKAQLVSSMITTLFRAMMMYMSGAATNSAANKSITFKSENHDSNSTKTLPA